MLFCMPIRATLRDVLNMSNVYIFIATHNLNEEQSYIGQQASCSMTSANDVVGARGEYWFEFALCLYHCFDVLYDFPTLKTICFEVIFQ